MEDVKLSIMIPVYNEVNTILEIIRLVKQEPHKKEIIIVDDCSTDGTRELLESLKDEQIKVFFNDTNHGKGYCIRRAIEHVSADIAIIQDADLEYYPDEYGNLIEKILEGKADVTYGTRFLGTHRVFNFYHYAGNAVLNFIANVMLNANLTDLMTCYKAFKVPALKRLTLKAERFGIETEITAEVFKRGYRIYEVPISYNARTLEDGKKIRWTDFFVCLGQLISASLRSADAAKDTLIKMTTMKNNNLWTFNKISPYLGKDILELGSGIGTFSRFIIGKGRRVTITDIDSEYTGTLKEKFSGNPSVNIVTVDACCIGNVFPPSSFDTVVGISFLEHVEDDAVIIEGAKKVLRDCGKIVLVVPAHAWLLGDFDRKIGHYRRYSKDGLTRLLETRGFKLEKIEYMNFIAAFGWFINFRLLNRKRMPVLMIKAADKFIIFTAWLEKYIKFSFGLSLFCVASIKKD